MKRLLTVTAALCLGLLARAQVEVRLQLDREYFLPGEDLEVALKVSNFTGGPLKLGDRPEWLRFTVERTDGGVVNKLTEVAESGEFTLQHATTGTMRFNLMPHFALDRAGSYRVVAEVTPVKNGETFTSAPARFDVVTGVRLNGEREVGVQLPDGTTERRKFILQQVNFLQKLQLYLRVCDARETKNYRVVALGPVVSFDVPKWVIDRQNRFHVLHRVDAKHSVYHVFEPDGVLARREVYRFTQTTPELRVNEDGAIAVIGGIRRPTRSDVPPPKSESVPIPDPAAPEVTPSPAAETNDTKPERTP